MAFELSYSLQDLGELNFFLISVEEIILETEFPRIIQGPVTEIDT